MLPIASLLFMHLLQLGALSLLEHMDVDAIHGSVELTATRNQFRNLAIFVKILYRYTPQRSDYLGWHPTKLPILIKLILS